MSAADWPVFAVLYGTSGRRHSRFYARSIEHVEARLRAPELADVVQVHAWDENGLEVTWARPVVGGAWVATKKDGA